MIIDVCVQVRGRVCKFVSMSESSCTTKYLTRTARRVPLCQSVLILNKTKKLCREFVWAPIPIYLQLCIHIYINIYIYIYILYMYIYANTYVYAYIYIYVYVYIYTCKYVTYIGTYICVYMYMCDHIYAPHIYRTMILPLTNYFVSTRTNSMKCILNWIPLRIRVRSRNTNQTIYSWNVPQRFVPCGPIWVVLCGDCRTRCPDKNFTVHSVVRLSWKCPSGHICCILNLDVWPRQLPGRSPRLSGFVWISNSGYVLRIEWPSGLACTSRKTARTVKRYSDSSKRNF